MKTIVSTREECLKKAADTVRRVLEDKPEAVLALSAGDDCLALYEKIAEDCAAGKMSLSRARLFSVAEFEGLDAPSPARCAARLRAFLEKTDAQEEQVLFLSEQNAESYDACLAAAGGIDLAILSLGVNARVGFNEPATPYASRTHRQKLAPATRRELAALFGGEEKVPEAGLTLGIKTLVEAKEVLLLAFGAERAKAVFDTLYGRDDSSIPAAFLQLPPNVTVVADGEAGAKL